MTRDDRTTIEVVDLCKHFVLRRAVFSSAVLKAVDHVDFSVRTGEVLVLMGESGCGKTTCALTAVNLLPPTRGTVRFEGQELFSLRRGELRQARRQIQIVLQNPLASLDPRVTVRGAIAEPLHIHNRALRLTRTEISRRVSALASSVGLREEELGRYPRNLSGGQQQRVCICRALILEPHLLVMDEPTSALDVSVQARVLNILLDLKTNLSLTYLFVTHSAAVARYVGDRVAIMYLGQIVEVGYAAAVLEAPKHPYSRGLMASVLTPNVRVEEIGVQLRGAPERPMNLPPGCVFQNRCPLVGPDCREARPELREAEPGRSVRCLRVRRALGDDGSGVGSLQLLGEPRNCKERT